MKDEIGPEVERLAQRLKEIRLRQGLTLSQVESRCGLGASTISKIENGTISPSYSSLLRLAKGLGVDIVELVSNEKETVNMTRRAITRKGEGPVHSIGSHDYRFLCSELVDKRMLPMLATIRARELEEVQSSSGERGNGQLFSHDGEEVLYVVKGSVLLITQHYSPVTLEEGDCAYIDSTMGHVCLSASEEDAQVLWVCTDLAFGPSSE